MNIAKKFRRRYLVKGGIHPAPMKSTASFVIAPGPAPDGVIIPLTQHVGAQCEPIVEVGERVLVGQKIGDSGEFLSAPVHSSISGEVTGFVRHPHPYGHEVLSIQIASDGKFELSPGVEPKGDPFEMSPEEIRKIIREGGIVGLGGATFPTHVKISPVQGKQIDTLILNGAECEPYLTGDHRLLLEKTREVIQGGLILKRAVNAREVVVAIESNKKDAIEMAQEVGGELGVEVISLPSRYPMGAEKTLIKTVLGREVPSGGLPMDVGALVDNIGTCYAIHELFYKGMPLVERVLTVQGDGIAGHANLRVRIGTLVHDVVEFCGGMVGKPGKLIIGGPMMGLAQHTTSVPVIKGTTGIIVFRGETFFSREPAHFVCIRCGRCVRRCPMNLMPYAFGAFADMSMWQKLDECHIDDCVECGCCAYVCPTKNPLVQLVKVGKEGVVRYRKKMGSYQEED
ncbi:MAG: electron transport complex subunit RsxC [Actinomycetota bacterium]|nr:electron transport complex subunit RsxC [Actinomycetota bacterium]